MTIRSMLGSLNVSVILLGVASHIDNYQPPEQSASVQHK
ncbi:division septum protein Blr [Escherichia coli]|nr:division septum protein Blr [Escherichia coli]